MRGWIWRRITDAPHSATQVCPLPACGAPGRTAPVGLVAVRRGDEQSHGQPDPGGRAADRPIRALPADRIAGLHAGLRRDWLERAAALAPAVRTLRVHVRADPLPDVPGAGLWL